jgi:branched-chain amino acid transport system ATP-binding protein
MSSALLACDALTMRFGGLTAVDEFSLAIQPGELLGLIGPNGAGKTTVFNLITGVYRPTAGSIRLEDASIIGRRPYRITASGIARTFQNIRLFGDLTVLDNVRLACHFRVEYGLIDSLVRSRRFRHAEAKIAEKSRRLLELLDLADCENHLARSLPYGEQRRLEIARALATEPKLLLLDEPAAGMNPQEKEQLARLVSRIRGEFQLAILLIEHDMPFVMRLCERLTVLDYGKIICRGTPAEVRANPDVIRAYLGGGDAGD